MKLRSGIAFLLMLVMMLAAAGIGAYRGYREEALLVQDARVPLNQMITARAEAAANVAVVAGRHVEKDDSDLRAVRESRELLKGERSLPEKAGANDRLRASAAALLEKMLLLPSVQQDSRDLMYTKSYLPQMLAESDAAGVIEAYNEAARGFNAHLQGSITGKIAQLLGIRAAEEFIAP